MLSCAVDIVVYGLDVIMPSHFSFELSYSSASRRQEEGASSSAYCRDAYNYGHHFNAINLAFYANLYGTNRRELLWGVFYILNIYSRWE